MGNVQEVLGSYRFGKERFWDDGKRSRSKLNRSIKGLCDILMARNRHVEEG